MTGYPEISVSCMKYTQSYLYISMDGISSLFVTRHTKYITYTAHRKLGPNQLATKYTKMLMLFIVLFSVVTAC